MAIVRIKGRLTADGKIEAELPDGWQPGEIDILIPQALPTFTDEAIEFQELTLGDIPDDLIGAGADWDIGDSAEWVAKQRQQREAERRNRWTE